MPPSLIPPSSEVVLDLFVFDDGAQFSVRQVNKYLSANHDLRRVTDDSSLAVTRNGVAAFQDRARAAFLQQRCQLRQLIAALREKGT